MSAREDTAGGRGDPLEGANPFESMSARDLAVLRLIIRQEVTSAVTAALLNCQAEQEDLRRTVFGVPDSPSGGLVGRVNTLETKAVLAQWLAGMALGSSLAAVAALVVSLITHQVRL